MCGGIKGWYMVRCFFFLRLSFLFPADRRKKEEKSKKEGGKKEKERKGKERCAIIMIIIIDEQKNRTISFILLYLS